MVVSKLRCFLTILVLIFPCYGVAKEPKLDIKVLMVAEPFGFGPSASIAQIMPVLRKRVKYIAFAGEKQSLDLQRYLPYDAIYEVSSSSMELDEIIKDYDVVISAMDFPCAKKAQENNIKVILYDAIFWYWDKVPEEAKSSDLYIVQDFIGVKERAKKENYSNIVVTPPLIQIKDPGNIVRNHRVHVNVGGLFNLHMPDDLLAWYAKVIGESVARENLPHYLLGNRRLNPMTGLSYENVSPERSQELLATSKFAIMTPGLANIFEAHQYNTPVLWLPPANASQAKQLQLMVDKGFTNAYIDWHHFLDIEKIDYNQPEQQVSKQILSALEMLSTDEKAQVNFRHKLKEVLAHADLTIPKNLFSEYGSNGRIVLADEITKYLEEEFS